MSKIAPCLWYDNEAEEAAKFYVSLLPNSRIDRIMKSPADTPSGKAGTVLLVEFTLAGQRFQGLNGGPMFKFTPAVSLSIDCKDQAEVDRLWDAILKNGGKESQCGWITDRWGLSWQIVPHGIQDLYDDPVKGKRAMEAMMKMVKLDMAALKRAYDGE